MTTRLQVVEADDLTTDPELQEALQTAEALLDAGLAQISVMQALLQETAVLSLSIQEPSGETIVSESTACEVMNIARIQLLDGYLQMVEVTQALRARARGEAPLKAA